MLNAHFINTKATIAEAFCHNINKDYTGVGGDLMDNIKTPCEPTPFTIFDHLRSMGEVKKLLGNLHTSKATSTEECGYLM